MDAEKNKEVKNIRKAGVLHAPKDYLSSHKNTLDTNVDRERKQGVENAPKKFDGSKKSVNDKTDQKRKKSGNFEAAEGAEKEFAEFRKKIREKLGLEDFTKGYKGDIQ